MARIRTIKPEFPQSESMGRVSRDARLLFILTWTLADDEGRLRGNSRMLASLLFPYDSDAGNLMDGWLDELVENNCLHIYHFEDSTYVQICKWLNHQKIDKPSTSKIPKFDESTMNTRESSRILAVGSRIKEGIKEGSGKDNTTVEQKLDVDVNAIWDFWKTTMSSPKSVCDKKRKNSIIRALQAYSIDQLCKAIRGCSKTPHNMGQNENRTKYNDIELILRDASHIDRFIANDNNISLMEGNENSHLGKAGQETAQAASRLREKMRAERGL